MKATGLLMYVIPEQFPTPSVLSFQKNMGLEERKTAEQSRAGTVLRKFGGESNEGVRCRIMRNFRNIERERRKQALIISHINFCHVFSTINKINL